MEELTADVGLCRLGIQISGNIGGLGVHAAFHVGNVVKFTVPETAFVMDQTGVVHIVEELGHGGVAGAGIGLVAQGPDQDGGMVLVPLIHGIGAIQHAGFPLGTAAGDSPARLTSAQLLPGAVTFHIGLVDQVDAITVTEAIPEALIGVMAGADGIQVVPLHKADVPHHIFLGDGTATLAVELVTVDATEQDALAVDVHDAVLHLEGAEAHVHGNSFHDLAVLVQHMDVQLVQVGFLGAPGSHIGEGVGEGNGVSGGLGLGQDGVALGILQDGGNGAAQLAGQLHLDLQLAVLVSLVQGASDQQVFHMGGGHGVQVDVTEDAGETPEVLVFDPAGAAALVDFHRQLVAAFLNVGGQVEFGGGEGILAIAYEVAVEPQIEGHFHALEGDGQGLALQILVDLKVADIAAHGVVGLADLRGPHVLGTIPGVLGVDVHHGVIALELDMTGDLNGVETGAVKISLVEILHTLAGVGGIGKEPGAVQVLAQGHVSLGFGLLCRFIIKMVRVRAFSVDLEDFGIRQPG